jgi:HK97 family phage prohead protease
MSPLPERALIEGYAAIFGEPDRSGDVVEPGAFLRGLIPASPAHVKMLHQHAAEVPLGRWRRFREDERGLFVSGEIFTDTRAGADLYRLLKGGAIDGLSIGFRPRRAVRTRTGRSLKEIDLWEVSIVTFPMAAGARVTRVAPLMARPPQDLLSSKRG